MNKDGVTRARLAPNWDRVEAIVAKFDGPERAKELIDKRRATLKRIQAAKQWTKVTCVETGLALLENSLTDAQAAPVKGGAK